MYTVTVSRDGEVLYSKRFDSMISAINYAADIEDIFDDLHAKVGSEL